MKKFQTPAMNTLTDCVNRLTIAGYTENFRVNKNGLKSLSDDKYYEASDISISNFYRFEGHSDPSDNAIVYVIETNDGKKGTLIDAYGNDADANIGEFIVQVEEIQKKVNISK